MNRPFFFGTVAFLLLANFLLSYLVLDRSVTIDHHGRQLTTDNEAITDLSALLTTVLKGKPRSEIEALLKQQPIAILKWQEAEEQLEANEMVFEFHEGKCVRVSVLNPPPAE